MRTHAQEIAAALTGPEARQVVESFLRAVERLDQHRHPARFVSDMRNAVWSATKLAYMGSSAPPEVGTGEVTHVAG